MRIMSTVILAVCLLAFVFFTIRTLARWNKNATRKALGDTGRFLIMYEMVKRWIRRK